MGRAFGQRRVADVLGPEAIGYGLAMQPGAQIRADFGSAAAPGIAFNGDEDTGFYRNQANGVGTACGAGNVFAYSATDVNMNGTRLLFANNATLAMTGYIELAQIATPAAPAVGKVRIYVADNGASKSQTRAMFDTGVAQVTNTEP